MECFHWFYPVLSPVTIAPKDRFSTLTSTGYHRANRLPNRNNWKTPRATRLPGTAVSNSKPWLGSTVFLAELLIADPDRAANEAVGCLIV
jgi:hypothetical protein